jgi:hypothetical protein
MCEFRCAAEEILVIVRWATQSAAAPRMAGLLANLMANSILSPHPEEAA